MRLRGLFLLLIVLLAGHAAAQAPRDPDAGLRGAVAPAQTVVEAAAHAMHLAVEEADRDGTPDQAIEILARIDAFIQDLKVDWRVSPSATYPDEAVAALEYAIDVSEALRGFPRAAATTATFAVNCDVQGGSTERHAVILLAGAELDAARARLRELVPLAPRGVDASSLAAGVERIRVWGVDHRIEERCAPPEELYMLLRVVPNVTHPMGRIRVVGSTNGGDSVDLSIPQLGLDQRVPVVDERFHLEWLVPPTAPLGVVQVRAHLGELEAEANLTIDLAPSQIIVRGPGSVRPGGTVAHRIYLVSPLQARVDDATILVDYPQQASIPLRVGAGTHAWQAPLEPQLVSIQFRYEGDDLVQPATYLQTVDVTVAQPPPPRIEEERTLTLPQGSLDPTTAVIAFTIVIAALAVWLGYRLRRARRIRTTRSRAAATIPAAEPTPAANLTRVARSGFVALFASLVLWLRARGTIKASTTPREVAATLRARGIPVDDAVDGFERARYGGTPLDAAASNGLASRLQAAWARVKEVFA